MVEIKGRVIAFFLNLFSLFLVLFFPSSSTMVSVVAIMALSAVWLFVAKDKDDGLAKKHKTARALTIVVIAFYALVCLAALFFATKSQLIICGENENTIKYYIQLNSDMIFWGGSSFEYKYFLIPISIIVPIYELANLIKFINFEELLSWTKRARKCIK